MEFVLVGPQIHSTFGSLGYLSGDNYCINDDCLLALEEIFKRLSTEDKILRTFRRAVGFGQNIKKDLIPILIHVKEDKKILEVTIKILVNLTIPIECLLSIDNVSNNDIGQHTIFELNNLLHAGKEAFLDDRAIKALMDYMKQILENTKALPTQLDNIHNCLLLLRNILHIPVSPKDIETISRNTTQNHILWNLFSQSIDKILIYLMTCIYGDQWSITMAQLIALIYKDQHVNNLQKLLNQWVDSSLSESSDDNESNTSPKNQGSGDSSLIVSSEQTSDSSDNGIKGILNNTTETQDPNTENGNGETSTPMDIPMDTSDVSASTETISENKQTEKKSQSNVEQNKPKKMDITAPSQPPAPLEPKFVPGRSKKRFAPTSNLKLDNNGGAKKERLSGSSEYSDCGYGTQNQESISTSSNDDDGLKPKPVHQKPHNQKPKPNNKPKLVVSIQMKKERRRRKLVKRAKNNIINMKNLVHHTPTDEDVTNILKEFTVDFLMKGFGKLVQHLHSQLLANFHLQIDTSHFFWLVTYFLKFSSQLELELEHIQKVLSFEILSYMTYEGVVLCEEIQLKVSDKNIDLKPLLRRKHLVVTAIREFIQTISNYEKLPNTTDEDKKYLEKLQLRISSSSDLRCLMVLFLRHYEQTIHTKQYLQDVVVTNHILLLFLDNASKLHADRKYARIMVDHLRQFATVDIMHPYGLLLETFESNGEFVNDCVFTMMHHVSGDLKSINTLFQPHILSAFAKISESDFELCDDWTDLLHYVINTFTKSPRPFNPDILFGNHDIDIGVATPTAKPMQKENFCEPSKQPHVNWSQEDIDSLHWFHTQSQKSPNVLNAISDMFRELGIDKNKKSIIEEMRKEDIISDNEFKDMISKINKTTLPKHAVGVQIGDLNYQQAVVNYNEELEKVDVGVTNMKLETIDEEVGSSGKQASHIGVETLLNREISMLIKTIQDQNMGEMIKWLQKILLELCDAKLTLANKTDKEKIATHATTTDTIEPVAFHSIFLNISTPMVPWNSLQSMAIHNQVFLTLLDKLGIHLPSDTSKYFIRIPNFWTTDILISTANKLGPVKKSLVGCIRCPQNTNIADGNISANEESPDGDEEMDILNEYSPPEIPSTSTANNFIHDDDDDDDGAIAAGLCPFRIQRAKQMNSLIQVTPLLVLKLSQIVIKPISLDEMDEDNAEEFDITQLKENLPDDVSLPSSDESSMCDSISVASDLGRMNVSDEE